MNAAAMSGFARTSLADATLGHAARFWFFVAVAGQWIFAVYITLFYGGAAAHANPQAWNAVLPHGYVAGNSVGNTMLAVHLLLAAMITAAGTLQLMPVVRARFPSFHRWNGRVYVVVAFAMALSGLYLVSSGRKVVGDTAQHMAIMLNAVLIMACAALALRFALARDFATHRRWALRLFIVVNGVWFFRVELMFWLFVNQGPVGFDPEAFTGPVLTFLAFSQMLVPLAVLEIYLRTKERGSSSAKLFTASGLVIITLAMALGEFAAVMGLWLPRL